MKNEKNNLSLKHNENEGTKEIFLQNESQDVIPRAEEISSYFDKSEYLGNWFLSKIDAEQNHRHSTEKQVLDMESQKVNNETAKIDAMKKSIKYDFIKELSKVIAVFGIFAISSIVTVYLIKNDMKIEGSAFGGMSLFFIIRAIIGNKQNVKTSQDKSNNQTQKK